MYKFPQKIKGFDFQKELIDKKSKHNFYFAIYKNGNKQAIAKMFVGNKSDKSYKSLLHEAFVTKILESLTPKVYCVIQKDEFFLILFEFINGNKLNKFSDSQKIKNYLNSVNNLRNTGSKLNKENKRLIGQRSSLFHIISYPYFVIMAIFSYPKYFLNIVSFIPIFLGSIIDLLKQNSLVLTHGDLHDDNILITKRKTYLLDFGFSKFQHPSYEFIVTLSCLWDDKPFINGILNHLKNQKVGLNKALSIKIVTQFLSDKNLSDKKVDNYISFLNFIKKI
ncbi:phosphotransferase [Candidatus Woesebacteria bacterium]|nr:phosphotransferase [Candidatus Woesebacteria bacterium]QQG47188.1 MAG: phosphotransferase [Candidatus Woesebacteria bacterium]